MSLSLRLFFLIALLALIPHSAMADISWFYYCDCDDDGVTDITVGGYIEDKERWGQCIWNCQGERPEGCNGPVASHPEIGDLIDAGIREEYAKSEQCDTCLVANEFCPKPNCEEKATRLKSQYAEIHPKLEAMEREVERAGFAPPVVQDQIDQWREQLSQLNTEWSNLQMVCPGLGSIDSDADRTERRQEDERPRCDEVEAEIKQIAMRPAVTKSQQIKRTIQLDAAIDKLAGCNDTPAPKECEPCCKEYGEAFIFCGSPNEPGAGWNTKNFCYMCAKREYACVKKVGAIANPILEIDSVSENWLDHAHDYRQCHMKGSLGPPVVE